MGVLDDSAHALLTLSSNGRQGDEALLVVALTVTYPCAAKRKERRPKQREWT